MAAAGGRLPIRPTTKECNSRARKHFGSWKARCYNRLTEGFFPLSSGFPARNFVATQPSVGKAAGPPTTVIKRIIS